MRDTFYRIAEEVWYTSNPSVYNKARRRDLDCSFDRPHRGDNRHGNIPRHDRYKSVRKGRCNGSTEPPWREYNGAPAKLYYWHRPSKATIGRWDYNEWRLERIREGNFLY